MFKAIVISFLIGTVISIAFIISISYSADDEILFALHKNGYKAKSTELQEKIDTWVNEQKIYFDSEYKKKMEEIRLCQDLIKNELLDTPMMDCSDPIMNEYLRFYGTYPNEYSQAIKAIDSCCIKEE